MSYIYIYIDTCIIEIDLIPVLVLSWNSVAVEQDTKYKGENDFFFLILTCTKTHVYTKVLVLNFPSLIKKFPIVMMLDNYLL